MILILLLKLDIEGLIFRPKRINDPDFIIELDIEGLIFRHKRIHDPDFIIYCLFYYSYEISMDH
jgi:hypothetical protein